MVNATSGKAPPPKLPLLGLTMGDPAGIGPEVIAKAVAGRALRSICYPIVIGSLPVMERTVKALKLGLTPFRVDGHEPLPRRNGTIAVLDPLDAPLKRFTPGVAAAETGAASVAFIEERRGARADRMHRRHRDRADQQRSHQYGRVSLSGPYRIAGGPDASQ
jgi:Pyridoxal phosphate biosynthesis protein